MMGALWQFFRFLPMRLRRIWNLSIQSNGAETYFPECDHKSPLRILSENIWWLLRYQEVNANYYLYGFDRKGFVDTRDYLSATDSRKMRNCVRKEWARMSGGYPQEVIVNDKFIFGLFCSGAGIPTPSIRALWDGKMLHYVRDGQQKPLESLLEQACDGVLKNCTGTQGKGVIIFRVEDGKLSLDDRPSNVDNLRSKIAGRWLIQDLIEQQDQMRRLYPYSINTVRIVTVMSGDEPRIFCANGRFGAGGNNKDNWSIGGITIAVDIEKGCFRGRGMFKPGYGTWVTHHPDTAVELDGFVLPFWSEAIALVLRAHRFFYGFHSLGWDVAFTPSGPILLEANHDWLLTFMQAVHGGLREKFYDTIPSHLRDRIGGCDIKSV